MLRDYHRQFGLTPRADRRAGPDYDRPRPVESRRRSSLAGVPNALMAGTFRDEIHRGVAENHGETLRVGHSHRQRLAAMAVAVYRPGGVGMTMV